MRSRLRVLIVIDGLGFGGAEMLLSEYVRGAPGAGIDASVAYLYEREENPAAVRLREMGIEPVCLGAGGLLNPSSLGAARRHMKEARPNLVHTHLGYSDFIAGIAARSLRIPTISTVHVTQADRSLRERVKLSLIAQVRSRCASRTIAVSDAARAACIQERWAPADRVVTLRNAILGDPRPGSGIAVRSELGIASDDLVVGMLSVLRDGKGHDVAVEAIRSLLQEFPKLKLLVIGDGVARSEVRAQVSSLGQAGVLAGHRDDVMEVLDAVDVLVHPSRYDAFPTALLEAMAAGLPVIASGVGGIPEIVVDGVTGRVLPHPVSALALAEALRPLLMDADERRRLGAAGRARFDGEFSLDGWMQRLRALYDEVLQEQPRIRRWVRHGRAS